MAKHLNFSNLIQTNVHSLAIYLYVSTFSSVLRHFFSSTHAGLQRVSSHCVLAKVVFLSLYFPTIIQQRQQGVLATLSTIFHIMENIEKFTKKMSKIFCLVIYYTLFYFVVKLSSLLNLGNILAK